MKFDIEKCIMLIMKGRKREITKEIELPNQESIDSVYVSIKEGKGLASIEDWVDASLQGFEDYI